MGGWIGWWVVCLFGWWVGWLVLFCFPGMLLLLFPIFFQEHGHLYTEYLIVASGDCFKVCVPFSDVDVNNLDLLTLNLGPRTVVTTILPTLLLKDEDEVLSFLHQPLDLRMCLGSWVALWLCSLYIPCSYGVDHVTFGKLYLSTILQSHDFVAFATNKHQGCARELT